LTDRGSKKGGKGGIRPLAVRGGKESARKGEIMIKYYDRPLQCNKENPLNRKKGKGCYGVEGKRKGSGGVRKSKQEKEKRRTKKNLGGGGICLCRTYRKEVR